ncbi:hypothetical protein ACTHR4_11150, partial [Neisseria sp. P0004.S009]|uniref:hypothetical protein n=1 Tax=Neisseria sp. P0004.S009 TaxID=3436673 RepID=UPI003F7FDE23
CGGGVGVTHPQKMGGGFAQNPPHTQILKKKNINHEPFMKICAQTQKKQKTGRKKRRIVIQKGWGTYTRIDADHG